jgi:hypothetical protein
MRGGAYQALATPRQLTVRPITLALAALAVAALLALTVALVSRGGDEAVSTRSVHVAPTAPIPPSFGERGRDAGLAGPGMRP